MRIGMPVSEALQAGFALATIIARDAGAERAHIGLAPAVRDAWCGLARDLARASKAERRQRIRALAAAARPELRPPTPLPSRGWALLAPRSPARARTAEGGAVDSHARLPHSPLPLGPPAHAPPRPGFVAEPGLLALLARIARRCAGP